MSGIDIVGPAVYLIGMNLIAFALFGYDKSCAQRGAWRVSEKALMLFALAGGSAGALAGMRVFHHKTRKPLFAIGVPAALIAHIGLLAWICVTVALGR